MEQETPSILNYDFLRPGKHSVFMKKECINQKLVFHTVVYCRLITHVLLHCTCIRAHHDIVINHDACPINKDRPRLVANLVN